MHRHRRAVVGRLPDRGQPGRPVAARPQYVENWPTWVVVNVVSVALFAYKGLWLTAGLYALFALLALAGWRGWVRRAAAAA